MAHKGMIFLVSMNKLFTSKQSVMFNIYNVKLKENLTVQVCAMLAREPRKTMLFHASKKSQTSPQNMCLEVIQDSRGIDSLSVFHTQTF